MIIFDHTRNTRPAPQHEGQQRQIHGTVTGAFDIIKSSVDILDVAAHYGVQIDRHGKALCFAHSEKTPSLSFNGNRFKCFGCGASGTVIDLVSIVQGITPLDAAKEIDAAYSLNLFNEQANTADIRRRTQRLKAERDKVKAFEEWERKACITWAAYCRILERFKWEYAPKTPEDDIHPLFAEALHKLDYADHIFHEIFINGSFEGKASFYQTHRGEVEKIEQRIRESGLTG